MKVTGGIRGRIGALRGATGGERLAKRLFALRFIPLRGAIRRVCSLQDFHLGVAPLNAQQLAPHLQHLGNARAPLLRGGLGGVNGLQILQVATETGAHFHHSLCGVAVELVLHLGRFIPPCQPHHGDEHAHDK